MTSRCDIGGQAKDHFRADELFVSTADSAAAHGRLTGRTHLAGAPLR